MDHEKPSVGLIVIHRSQGRHPVSDRIQRNLDHGADVTSREWKGGPGRQRYPGIYEASLDRTVASRPYRCSLQIGMTGPLVTKPYRLQKFMEIGICFTGSRVNRTEPIMIVVTEPARARIADALSFLSRGREAWQLEAPITGDVGASRECLTTFPLVVIANAKI